MNGISKRKSLPKHYRIYEQICENPLIPSYQISKNTGICRSTISRYIINMYEHSLIKGPMIFVKPARNCHHYAVFLKFENPMEAFKNFQGFPHVISRTLASGSWNLLLVCEKLIDFSELKGFQNCIIQDAKSITYVPKVVSLEWETSLQKIHSVMTPPNQKTTLYEEISHNPWNRKQWTLYHHFKHNIRTPVMPVLKQCQVKFEQYQEWFSELPEVAYIQTAFYPQGVENYFIFDFLFQSEYQKQLTNILGMFPSSSIFFSVGKYLLARVFLLNKKEKDDLFVLVFQLGEKGFFTDVHQTVVVSTGEG